MRRLIGYVLALVVLTGVAYAVYLFAPRAPEASVPSDVAAGSTTGQGTEMRVTDVYESTNAYRIEAHYPQFGIPAADEKIKAVVDAAIAGFKSYPTNPPDSSTPQNEFAGSFNSTYVGPDVVSVALSFSEDTGGAHPNTVVVGVNVDRKTGKELTLDDALALLGKTLSQVADNSLVQLKSELGENFIFPDGAKGEPANYSTFLVSKDKVTFIFNNYQVAPYSSGRQSVWFKRMK
ncbi:hypothetical protein A3D71_02105 [Candidatus Kaiserbacteria bacterium RIFCSPHIGHO2_02_FULL_55_20]|uniref:DUF3298 domain-containing protein n=1 Tax=Candidatus Kaiserbacteria bacterium RIFCSPHIGHO2_02_FULL_55_20 TaxID=1798497 RepID=A0A1F6DXI5_9BACT|nr:MAG: hypothetical protein A2680_02965 [Candidatus Kaiserbacteria bacterium RIFCSPHIGHO2_01_FULL_55_37]OGG65990.1 MAG: hypothetical protein A3D71_02105 [Candidatus Kaiserbacteria bacterium RIFCSPHIGHO2_02_FULL_55_20]